MNTDDLETLALYVTERFRNTALAEDLKSLAPLIGLLALFFIGSGFICAFHRRLSTTHWRCCSKKADKKQIDGEYVKYGAYFDRSYNEKIDENDSDEQQRSSTQINLEIEPEKKNLQSITMDPQMIDKQPDHIER